jgi:hypothetical protein
MNETTLRWKARLGSLKAVAALVLVFAVIFLFGALNNLSIASNNPTEPQPATIRQLVENEIGMGRYVSVSGVALYPAAYEETEDGKTVAEYFYLVDDASGHVLVVKASKSLPIIEQEEPATIVGLTHVPEPKLQQLIESDVPDFRDVGFALNPGLYLGDGEKPPDAAQNTTAVVGLGILSVLCVATFFFPGRVFAPKPVDTLAAAQSAGSAEVKASGRFQKLSSVRPSIQVGKGTRKFDSAIANLITLDDRRLMVYIHHIMSYKTYGITVRKEETDWGVFVDQNNLVDIEPGILYGWKDRPAVQLRYNDDQAKQQTLIVSFDRAGGQAQFVEQLRRMGFMVGSGDAPLM